MIFDIKDVKSWATRHDVKVGDEGYFADSIDTFRNSKKKYIALARGKIGGVLDDYSTCFQIENSCGGFGTYAFFIPLEAVKEDKPKEKKYRRFKDLYEFYQFLSFDSDTTREDFNQNMLLGLAFTYREKKALRVASTTVINRIDFDLADDPCEPNVEGRNLGMWFDYSEIMNAKGEWQPFGVEA